MSFVTLKEEALIKIFKMLGKSSAAVGGAVAAAEAGTGAGMLIKDGSSAATMRRRLYGKKKSQSEGMDPPVTHGTDSRAIGVPGRVLRLVPLLIDSLIPFSFRITEKSL